MNYKLFFVACALFCLPVFSHAYEVESTATFQLTDTSYVVLINYQLGFEKYGMDAPIGAMVTGNSRYTPGVYLEYELTHSDRVVDRSDYESNGIVLGNATVDGATYSIEQGSASSFTLLAVVTLTDPAAAEGAELQVTALPFTLQAEDGSQRQNGLSSGELSYYRSAPLE